SMNGVGRRSSGSSSEFFSAPSSLAPKNCGPEKRKPARALCSAQFEGLLRLEPVNDAVRIRETAHQHCSIVQAANASLRRVRGAERGECPRVVDETMKKTVAAHVSSDNDAGGVDAPGIGQSRSRRINLGEFPCREREAVLHAKRIGIPPYNRAGIVDPIRPGIR